MIILKSEATFSCYRLLLQKIGEDWTVHLEQLAQLKPLAKDPNFQRAVMKVKQENKLRLAAILEKDYGVKINVASIFDIQVATQHISELLECCVNMFAVNLFFFFLFR